MSRVLPIDILPVSSTLAAQGRHREPVTLGVPLQRGEVMRIEALRLTGPDDEDHPLQARALDLWPDGSVRWALLDFQVSYAPAAEPVLFLKTDGPAHAEEPQHLSLETRHSGVRIRTGRLSIEVRRGEAFPFSSVSLDSRPILAADSPGFVLTTGASDETWTVSDVEVLESGPLRAELLVRASTHSREGGSPLEISARVEVFSSTPVVRVGLTLRNTRRATHPGGQWPLGDDGSLYLRSASVTLRLHTHAESIAYTVTPSEGLHTSTAPLELLQASSGGNQWQARTHVNRHGRVSLPFRGYRLRTGQTIATGERASPIVQVTTGGERLSAAIPRFWQEFPHAVSVDSGAITLGLLPAGIDDEHELQGGEQTTRVFSIAFGDDSVSATPLAWCFTPTRFYPSPGHVERTGAIPCWLPAAADPHPEYVALVDVALDPQVGFFAKREAADEYGWRHFGDLPADHESAFQPADRPFVSHYNNQYDAIAGFAVHFLRTGDGRWWTLMDDLARHVCDIDIYRTDQDKPAYNNGLFWHTNHYVDAGTSTHRTYPPGATGGGGPSAEHNYNYGLMLHYFLTGNRVSRDTAIALGQWVIDMDDGSRTPFRWLSRRDTGLASASGPSAYQGAGRGAGHSILACLAAHQLSGAPRFLNKAETLIRRCVHPRETVPMRYVEDIEGFWSYTAFLQAVGIYLHHKVTLNQLDDNFAYARESLLNHARWMLQNERPYMERRERLDYPTETWVAQDLRKADVFMWAAIHSSGDERASFTERAMWFFNYAVSELPKMTGHWFSRPLVLVLTQGYRLGWFAKHVAALAAPLDAPSLPALPPARLYQPQKATAIRRAAAIAIGALLGTLALAGLLILRSM